MASGLPEWVMALFPGGAAVAVIMLVQAWKIWKEARNKNEESILARWQKEIKRLEDKNKELEVECDYKEELIAYWRNRSGTLEYNLRINKIEFPPYESLPVRRTQPELESVRS